MHNLIEITIEILLFYLIYIMIKPTFSLVNRIRLLLLIPIFPLLIITIKQLISSYTDMEITEFVELDIIEVSESKIVVESNWFRLETLYIAGFVFSSLVLLFKILRINNFFKTMDYEYNDGIKLYKSDSAESFTFLNKIHLNSNNHLASPIIEEHERIHVEKKHTVQLLLMEVYQLFFWFIPVLYFMKIELKKTQEYQVDQIMYKRYNTKYIEILLNNTLQTLTPKYLLTSQFITKLNLAQRTKIMKKSMTQNYKFIAVIPLVALLFSFVTFTSDNTPEEIKTEEYQKDVIVYPEFKGGSDALMKYLKENITYPEKAKAAKKEGRVYVGFVVNKRGKVKKVKVKRKLNDELDAAAIKTIKSMPRWIPGTKNGKKANIEMVLPIQFKLK